MKAEIIITDFSNVTKEGIVFHLNEEATFKTGNVAGEKFYVSWDAIGRLLFDDYTERTEVDELRELRKETPKT